MKPSPALDALPEPLAYQVRTASLTLPVRAVVADLPRPLHISGWIGRDVERLPTGARQLLKLAVVSPRFELEPLHMREGDGVELTITRSDGDSAMAVPLDAELLAGNVEDLIFGLLPELFAVSELGDLLQRFAFRSAVLQTLHRITRHMLQSTDVDEALYVMLSGITSGYALGFNRAALFIPQLPNGAFGTADPSDVVWVGQKAIGPLDEREAFRIWESIEVEDKTVDDLIADYTHRNFETRFQQHVQTLNLMPTDAPGDELRRVFEAEQPLCCEAPPVNTSLRQLDGKGEFALAALRAHGRVLAVVYADNVYNRAPIDAEQLGAFGFFIAQTALIWENLALLERVGEQATRDPLTGVLNRRGFTAAAQPIASAGAWSLLILDLDGFKQVNDTLGHDAGDDALCLVAEVMRAVLPDDAVVARHGGDEFVAAIPGCSADALPGLIKALGDGASAASVSISVGAAASTQETPGYDALFVQADVNLFDAKRAGRRRGSWGDGVVGFDPLPWKTNPPDPEVRIGWGGGRQRVLEGECSVKWRFRSAWSQRPVRDSGESEDRVHRPKP